MDSSDQAINLSAAAAVAITAGPSGIQNENGHHPHHHNHNNHHNNNNHRRPDDDDDVEEDLDDHEQGHHNENESFNLIVGEGEEEVSPSSLRRSTRASALKAQEKLKFKDGMGLYPVPNGVTEANNADDDLKNGNESDGDSGSVEPKKKKPKLCNGFKLDQYDCKFGVRGGDDGDVYMLSDESEISSLTSEEVSDLRENYERIKAAGVTSEQKYEREIQISELESQLRIEEQRLAILSRTRQVQLEAEAEELKHKKLLAEAALRQKIQMNAYQPTVVPATKVNGTTPKHASKGRNNNTNAIQDALRSLTPQQQQQFMQKLMSTPHINAQAIMRAMHPNFLQSLQNQQNHSHSSTKAASTSHAAAAATPTVVPPTKKEPPQPTTTPAQRINDARRRLRQTFDAQLTQIPQPKAIVNDLAFVPSITTDFLALLGLDLTVQRVLKDKNVFKKFDARPYECEECGTDFTPTWKAIGTSENDLHLYCEACVRTAQKRKIRSDQNAVYKRIFATVAEQEKELEKQIAAGKFDEPPAPPPPPPAPKPATPVVQKPASTAATAAAAASIPTNNIAAALLMAQNHQARVSAASTASSSQPSTSAQASRSQSNSQQRPARRQAQSASQNSTPNASHAAALQQYLLQTIMASNPQMGLSAMNYGNSNVFRHLLSQLTGASGGNNATSQQQQQQSSRSSSNNSAAAAAAAALNPGMAALLQVASQANNGTSNNNNLLALLQVGLQRAQNQGRTGGSTTTPNLQMQQMMQQIQMMNSQGNNANTLRMQQAMAKSRK